MMMIVIRHVMGKVRQRRVVPAREIEDQGPIQMPPQDTRRSNVSAIARELSRCVTHVHIAHKRARSGRTTSNKGVKFQM
jgi:hypothetical protein